MRVIATQRQADAIPGTAPPNLEVCRNHSSYITDAPDQHSNELLTMERCG